MTPQKPSKFPDYRFTLANERTFLAWIRTALAFMAAAVGIDQLAVNLTPVTFRIWLVVILSLTAAGLAFYAYRRWIKNENAMRQETALPFPRTLAWLSGGLSVCILAMLAVMVTQ